MTNTKMTTHTFATLIKLFDEASSDLRCATFQLFDAREKHEDGCHFDVNYAIDEYDAAIHDTFNTLSELRDEMDKLTIRSCDEKTPGLIAAGEIQRNTTYPAA